MILAYPLILFSPLFFIFSYWIAKRNTPPPLPFVSISFAAGISRSVRQRIRTPLLAAIAASSSLLLAFAASRPQRITIHPQAQEARNLILTIDLSRSMTTEDFNYDGRRSSRLDGVKAVVDDLLKNRTLDRIGLVVFGVQAFLQAPLTFDHGLISQMVKSLQSGVAGDGTAIGDGLGLSIKRLENVTGNSRAVVLITDGANNSGNVNPLKAAHVAKELGIKVHTIGIGGNQPPPLLSGLVQGSGAAPLEFDEKLLREVAELTGGLYSSAHSAKDLRAIYQAIEALDSSESQQPSVREVEELFALYALAGLVLASIGILLSRSYFLKVPI